MGGQDGMQLTSIKVCIEFLSRASSVLGAENMAVNETCFQFPKVYSLWGKKNNHEIISIICDEYFDSSTRTG